MQSVHAFFIPNNPQPPRSQIAIGSRANLVVNLFFLGSINQQDLERLTIFLGKIVRFKLELELARDRDNELEQLYN